MMDKNHGKTEKPWENMEIPWKNHSHRVPRFFLSRFSQDDGSGHAIRYWPREERWLIDLDGLHLVLVNIKIDGIYGCE